MNETQDEMKKVWKRALVSTSRCRCQIESCLRPDRQRCLRVLLDEIKPIGLRAAWSWCKWPAAGAFRRAASISAISIASARKTPKYSRRCWKPWHHRYRNRPRARYRGHSWRRVCDISRPGGRGWIDVIGIAMCRTAWTVRHTKQFLDDMNLRSCKTCLARSIRGE